MTENNQHPEEEQTFELHATMMDGHVITVKVSGFRTIEEGAAAFMKLATYGTLNQVVRVWNGQTPFDEDDDWVGDDDGDD